jgi:Cytochrome bd terminal oxidase subunit I
MDPPFRCVRTLARGDRNGLVGITAVAVAIRLHRLFPHHISIFHDRIGGVADHDRGSPPGPAYRIIFDFWLKIFGVAFGLGVVSGIVMAFEFGTNWGELSRARIGAETRAAPHL